MLCYGKNHIPLDNENGQVTVHLFRDTGSLEVYAGNQYACFAGAADPLITSLTLTGERETFLCGWQLARSERQ